MEETLAGLRALNGDMVANSCRRTLNTLVLNAIDNVENKIYEILELIGEKVRAKLTSLKIHLNH